MSQAPTTPKRSASHSPLPLVYPLTPPPTCQRNPSPYRANGPRGSTGRSPPPRLATPTPFSRAPPIRHVESIDDLPEIIHEATKPNAPYFSPWTQYLNLSLTPVLEGDEEEGLYMQELRDLVRNGASGEPKGGYGEVPLRPSARLRDAWWTTSGPMPDTEVPFNARNALDVLPRATQMGTREDVDDEPEFLRTVPTRALVSVRHSQRILSHTQQLTSRCLSIRETSRSTGTPTDEPETRTFSKTTTTLRF